jgi:hypothetical protein
MKLADNPNDFIPDFEPLWKKTIEYVKAYQGEKGYIDTQNNNKPANDTIYGISYDHINLCTTEQYVYGVRVRKEDGEDDLQVLLEPICSNTRPVYEDADFTNDYAEWVSVRWSDVYYVHTLISIAESIWEYDEE